MKKILSLMLVLALLAVALVSCGTKYSQLEKAFKDEGYEVSETLEGLSEDIKKEMEKEELSVELHVLSKSILNSVLIIEFKSTEDLVKACEESATLSGIVTDVKNSEDVQKAYDTLEENGFAKGSCLIVPLSLNVSAVTDIVKSVK